MSVSWKSPRRDLSISRYNADLVAMAKHNSLNHMEYGPRTLFSPSLSLSSPYIHTCIHACIHTVSKRIAETVVIRKKRRQPAFSPSVVCQKQTEGRHKCLVLWVSIPVYLFSGLVPGEERSSCLHFTYQVHSAHLRVNHGSLASRGKSGERAVTRFSLVLFCF